MFKIYLVFSFVILIGISIGFGQTPTLINQDLLRAEANENYFHIAATADSGFVTACYSSSSQGLDKTEGKIRNSIDLWLVKYDKDFNIEWQNTIGGENSDYCEDIIVDSDNNILIAARSDSNIWEDKSENSRGNWDYWVVKINPFGIILWEKTIGGSGVDLVNSIAETPEGDYIVSGYSDSPNSGDKSQNSFGKNDFWVVKLSKFGIIQWEKTIGGMEEDLCKSVLVNENGDIYLGGNSSSNAGGLKSENRRSSRVYSDFWVIKLDPNGNKIWDKVIGSLTSDTFTDMAFTSDYDLVLVGSSSFWGADKTESSFGSSDFWVVKLSRFGFKIWDRTYGGSESDNDPSVGIGFQDQITIGGNTRSGFSGNKQSGLKYWQDSWILNLDSNGNYRWDQTYGSYSYNTFYDLVYTKNNEIVFSCSVADGASGDIVEQPYGWDGWFAKIKECPFIDPPTANNYSVIKGRSQNLIANCSSGIPTWYNGINPSSIINVGSVLSIDVVDSNSEYYVKCNYEGCLSSNSTTVLIEVFCPDEVIVDSDEWINIYANDRVESSMSLQANRNFFSGKSVLLKPGFFVEGYTFLTEIKTCDN